MSSIDVHSFTFNLAGENTYVLSTSSGEACIIDPGCSTRKEEEVLHTYIDSHRLTPTLCLCTHKHFDHVLGCHFIQQQWGLTPYLSSIDEELLPSVSDQLRLFGVPGSGFSEPSYRPLPCDDSGFTWAGISVRVLSVPGHSPGHVAFYLPDQHIAFTGDALFNESIGRTDLWYGDGSVLLRSICERLLTLPSCTTLYPGHGPSTTVEYEKTHNPFLKKNI